MRPIAKKNLHQCEYHLNTMRHAKNSEEFEIGYSAFVMSARTVTFVLQKEFSKNKRFMDWYSTKQKEMGNDRTAKFFLEQRNSIEKEGINALEFSLEINSLQLPGNDIYNPENADIQILPNGIFYLINKGTSKEDLIPAKVTGDVTVRIFLKIEGQIVHVLKVAEAHYLNLKEIVEEWTEIMRGC